MELRGKYSEHCKRLGHCRRKKKIDGFLNCYHFAYTGRDTANIAISQLNRIALGLIRKTSNLESEIDQIAQRRIKQVINQGG